MSSKYIYDKINSTLDLLMEQKLKKWFDIFYDCYIKIEKIICDFFTFKQLINFDFTKFIFSIVNLVRSSIQFVDSINEYIKILNKLHGKSISYLSILFKIMKIYIKVFLSKFELSFIKTYDFKSLFEKLVVAFLNMFPENIFNQFLEFIDNNDLTNYILWTNFFDNLSKGDVNPNFFEVLSDTKILSNNKIVNDHKILSNNKILNDNKILSDTLVLNYLDIPVSTTNILSDDVVPIDTKNIV